MLSKIFLTVILSLFCVISINCLDLARFKRDEQKEINILQALIVLASSQDGINVSAVAWEHVHGDDGKLKEVNSINLVVPVMGKFDGFPSYVFDESDIGETVKFVQEVFEEELTSEFVQKFATAELWNDEGKEIFKVFYKANGVLVDMAGLNRSALNYTVFGASPDQIEKVIKHANEKNKIENEAVVIKRDSEGKLLEGSHIHPNHLIYETTITDSVPDSVVFEAPQVFAEVCVKHNKENIPEELAKALDKKFPDYNWGVLVNEQWQWIPNQQFNIRFRFDEGDLEELWEKDTYYVMALNKTQAA